MGARGLMKMVVALVALILGSMVLVGDGPEVAMGSDEPALSTEELAALDAESVEPTVSKAEENPALLTSAPAVIESDPEPVLEAALSTATDAAVVAALEEMPADESLLEEEAAAAVGLTTVGVVLGQRVNVRSGPSTGDGVIGQVVLDQEVEILGYEDNGWAHILLNGEDGYMSGDFLQEVPQG